MVHLQSNFVVHAPANMCAVLPAPQGRRSCTTGHLRNCLQSILLLHAMVSGNSGQNLVVLLYARSGTLCKGARHDQCELACNMYNLSAQYISSIFSCGCYRTFPLFLPPLLESNFGVFVLCVPILRRGFTNTNAPKQRTDCCRVLKLFNLVAPCYLCR